ncbi:class II aldolase/adducin family protein [Kamptonema cortianum]|nr:class II aldolase/adducin family protein [Kamptonema cortianum]MDL5046294.1 class II aldolase/adducin family protein [Oscillatoria amoena NRMC-F 0135]
MKLFTEKDAVQFASTGKKEFAVPTGMIVTPGAKDVFAEHQIKIVVAAQIAPGASGPVSASKDPVQALFTSEEAERVKKEICEMGRRLWAREYVDGNGGNISYRIGPNQVLCTPTLVSKGFMTPDMICMVDLEGNQIAGSSKRTSEITTHLALYKGNPNAKAVVHAHPVHATAFAIAGIEPPACLIPEYEVFVGRAPLAPYKTPGGKEMAEIIQPLAAQHQSILMGNHGVICWGFSVEDAYWKMEITDAYCRTLLNAMPLKGDATIPGDEVGKLLELRSKLGMPDPREGLKPVQLCEVDPWEVLRGKTASGSCGCGTKEGESSGMTEVEVPEEAVQKITDQIMKAFGGK